MKYLIWSIEHQGWWRPNENGYTQNIDEAGRYEFEKALEIVRSANRYVLVDREAIPNEAIVPIQ